MPERLGQSFKEVLKDLNKQDEQSLCIYDYGKRSDFRVLWNLRNPKGPEDCEKPPEQGPIIILWDGQIWEEEPNEELLLPHLTPMDWALAFSINNPDADISIHIVDLTGKEDDGQWAMQMRHQLLVEMPWVKLYAPLIPEKVRVRQGYNPIIAPVCFDGASLVLLEDRSDVGQDQELPRETLPEEAIEGNQHPEPSKKPTKPPSLFERLWLWISRREHIESSPIVPEPASNDSSTSSEETNEENQSESSREKSKSEDSSGLRLNLSGETLKDAKTSDDRNRLIKLAKQWGASLTWSDDHHDVNNVIGPRILACQENDSSSALLDAFHKRLSWCDLIKEGAYQKTVTNWERGSNEFEERGSNEFEPFSIFVVDDHLKQGWGKFVCSLLGFEECNVECANDSRFVELVGNERVKIYGSSGPEPLIDVLKEAKFDKRDFSKQIDCSNQVTPEIVLLDLRLYASTDLDRELAKKLLCVINNLPRNGSGLAWDEIDPREIKEIEKWCRGEQSDPKAKEMALLLLPRLLAMALPLTPIILFSSTGQAWIKETLKPYQNIITGFEKPRVLSNPESVENSNAALREGLDKAVKMMRLRLQLAHAQKAVEIAAEGSCQGMLQSDHHHIEIYADETGTIEEGIASGVAFCVFPSEDKADCLQTKLEEYNGEQNDKGIGINRNRDEFKLKKANDADAHRVQTLTNLLNNVDIRNRQSWSVIRTKMPGVEIDGNADVSLGTFPDSPLDYALRFNLEFSLFVLIPYLSSNFTGEVSVYLPTRDVSLPLGINQQVADAFDLHVPNYRRERMLRTWPHGSGFPIARGWLHEWGDGGSSIYDKIKKIKMTALGDQNNIIKRCTEHRSDYPRLFHGIADWVCSTNQRPRNYLEEHDLFPSLNWFVSANEEVTEGGRILMQALKASKLRSGSDSEDRNSDALRLILRNSYIDRLKEELLTSESCSQQRLILWALRDELNHATGPSLHLLCV